MVKDLTVGSVHKVILKFAIPMIAGNMLQQIYNMVDSIIVGRFVGENELAGIGVTTSLNYFIVGFIIGISTGFCIPIAQAFGEKNNDKIRKFYANAIILTLILSVVITVLSLFFLEDILLLIDTPPQVMSHTISYASTMFMGLMGIFFYNLMAGVMRALGDSKTPLFFLIFSSALNVALSLIFVIAFNMGVFGTGLATAISQSVSAILCLITAYKKYNVIKINKSEFVLRWPIIKVLLKIGIPMGLQVSITAIGTIAVQSAINSLGALYVLSCATAIRVSVLFMQGLETLGLAMATYTGQNIGAGKVDRIKKGVKQALIIGSAYSVLCVIIIYFFGIYAAAIFIKNPSPELSYATYQFLMGNAGLYIILCALLVFRSTIQGLGYSSLSMISGFSETAMRVVISFVLVNSLGYSIIIFANPLAWFTALLVVLPMYFKIIKNYF